MFRPDAVEIGYPKGVPMGGDLSAALRGKAPVFMVGAAKRAAVPSIAHLHLTNLVYTTVKGINAHGKTNARGFYDEKYSRYRQFNAACSD